MNTTIKHSLNPIITELERFYNHLNDKFKLSLSSDVVITIQNKGSKNALGWFGVNFWNNEKGEQINEINICAESLKVNPYETLAHEIAHFCELKEKGKLSKGNYHGKTFKKFAEQLLLKVNKVGKIGYAHTEITPEFDKMLFEFKPEKEVFEITRFNKTKKKAPTKLKKWTCSCGVNVRCAVELNAECNECNTKFIREDKGEN